MNRSMALGTCEISFSHEYVPTHQFNSKKSETRVIELPKATNITIKHGDETVSTRVSCSHKDSFKYETGRKLAMKKAFSLMTSVTKDERKRVWEEYNKLKTGGRW